MCTKCAQPGFPTHISIILFHLYSTIPTSPFEASAAQPLSPIFPISCHLTASKACSHLLTLKEFPAVLVLFQVSYLASCFSSRKDHSNSYFLYVFTCYNTMAGRKINNNYHSCLHFLKYPLSEAFQLFPILLHTFLWPPDPNIPALLGFYHSYSNLCGHKLQRQETVSQHPRVHASFDNTVCIIGMTL